MLDFSEKRSIRNNKKISNTYLLDFTEKRSIRKKGKNEKNLLDFTEKISIDEIFLEQAAAYLAAILHFFQRKKKTIGNKTKINNTYLELSSRSLVSIFLATLALDDCSSASADSFIWITDACN